MAVTKDKKTGKWFCRVSYKLDGKYKTVTRKGFATKQEALLKEAQIKLNLEEGKDVDSNPNDVLTFAQYFEDWVYRTKVDRGFSNTTEQKYIYNIKLVKDYFKDIPFKSVTREMYQDFIDKRGRNRSKDTVEKTNSYIRSCVQDALYDGVIDKDFTYRVLLTYDVEEKSSDKKFWNKDEFIKLMEYLKEEIKPASTILLIQGLTGLRIGEVYGLSWNDIKDDTLTVNRGYDYTKFKFTDGKTLSALRTIIITEELSLALKKYKLVHGRSDYLFLDNISKKPLVSYNAVRKYLSRVCTKLAIPSRSPHALRHTHCSVLINDGVDLAYISQRLGHNSLNETIDTYSHIIKEKAQREDQKAIAALNNLILHSDDDTVQNSAK